MLWKSSKNNNWIHIDKLDCWTLFLVWFLLKFQHVISILFYFDLIQQNIEYFQSDPPNFGIYDKQCFLHIFLLLHSWNTSVDVKLFFIYFKKFFFIYFKECPSFNSKLMRYIWLCLLSRTWLKLLQKIFKLFPSL